MRVLDIFYAFPSVLLAIALFLWLARLLRREETRA